MNNGFHTDITPAVLHPWRTRTRGWWVPLASGCTFALTILWTTTLRETVAALTQAPKEQASVFGSVRLGKSAWIALPDPSDSTYGLMYVSPFRIFCSSHFCSHPVEELQLSFERSLLQFNRHFFFFFFFQKGIPNKSTRSVNINKRGGPRDASAGREEPSPPHEWIQEGQTLYWYPHLKKEWS